MFRRLPSCSRKPRHRIVFKSGKRNIHKQNPTDSLCFLRFARLVDASWTKTILIFMTIILSSSLLFGVMYWLICKTHGDFEPQHLPSMQEQNNFLPCVYEVYGFWSCILFSIETQHTVGYGIKATTVECPEAIFVNSLQCNIGYIMQGIMAVIIFSKMALPRLRSQTIVFSKQAAICYRNHKLCLTFRIGDMRKKHTIETKIKAFFVRSERTIEGQVLDHNSVELALVVDNCTNEIFFNWPLVAVHEITSESALYHLTPNDLNHDSFEVVVLLEGTTHTTEQMIQARTSYLPSEMVWGYKFDNLVTFDEDTRLFDVDFSRFDGLVPVATPQCSAAYLYEYNEYNQVPKSMSSSETSVLQISFLNCKSSDEEASNDVDNSSFE